MMILESNKLYDVAINMIEGGNGTLLMDGKIYNIEVYYIEQKFDIIHIQLVGNLPKVNSILLYERRLYKVIEIDKRINTCLIKGIQIDYYKIVDS